MHSVELVLSDKMIEQIRRNRARKLAAQGQSEPIEVIWQHWRITQSEFHYREAGEVDLGNLDE
jgi:hypothetical protein